MLHLNCVLSRSGDPIFITLESVETEWNLIINKQSLLLVIATDPVEALTIELRGPVCCFHANKAFYCPKNMQSYERIQIAQFPIVPVLDETKINMLVIWRPLFQASPRLSENLFFQLF